MASYAMNLTNTHNIKNAQGENQASTDLRVMVNDLMLEQLWKKKQTSIDMFTLKKHM